MTRQIHIVGSSPRTGTTLLMELMRHGFAIEAACEHERPLSRPPGRASVYLSKQPSDVRIAERALAVDPNLWILHMVRDPRDVVVSRHEAAPGRYWTHLGLWRLYRRAARRVEGHSHFLTIRYEDLVRDPDAVQARIAGFAPFLKERRRFSDVHAVAEADTDRRARTALGGVRPVSTDSIGRWREHKPRLVAQLALYGPIDKDLIELGYEADASWRAELSDVTPAHAQSVLRGPGHFRLRFPARVGRVLGVLTRWYRARWPGPLGPPAGTGPFAIETIHRGEIRIETGDLGRGPLVVLLPGLSGAGTEQYGALAQALSSTGFHAVTLNSRGTGTTKPPAQGSTLHDLASDVAAVIRHYGGPAHVVGRAFGNRVARCLATDSPDLVRSLTLIAAGGLQPAAAFARRRRGSRRWPLAYQSQLAADAAVSRAVWQDGGRAPMLVIQAKDDPIAAPENGRRLAAGFPDRVQLVELERGGHNPLAHCPYDVIPRILEFLRSQPERR